MQILPSKSQANGIGRVEKIENKPTEVNQPISTENITITPTTPKRRNPLFIGDIEDDIPVEDPYFNHNGNLTSFMNTYVHLHDKLISSNSKRVVIYMPMKETGLGNSLLALSSSFIYAVLTKRAFCCMCFDL